MADSESIRQRIVSSVFTKLTEETYAAHIKIWEEASPDEGGKKPRYIILSRMLRLLRIMISPLHASLSQSLLVDKGSSIRQS